MRLVPFPGRTVVAVLGCLLVLGGSLRLSAAPSADRVREIAGWLPDDATSCGPSIDDRASWAAYAARARNIIEEADLLLTEPIPALPDDLFLEYFKTGDRTGYQRPYGRRGYRLATFVQAECAVASGRYMPAIEAELAAILSERTWVLPAHDSDQKTFKGDVNVDLGAAHRAGTIAVAISWLGDRLSDPLRRKALVELDRRIFAPYLERIRTGAGPCSWVNGTNNWNAVCNGAVVSAALAVVPDRTIRAEIIAGAESSLASYLSGFTDDGYCREGLGYWNYGFGHYVLLAEAVLRSTRGKVNLYANPKVQKIASFPVNFEMADGLFPSFGDVAIYPASADWVRRVVGARLGWTFLAGPPAPLVKVTGSGPLGSSLYVNAIVDFPLPAALAMSETGTAATPDPLRGWFPDAGILVSRMEETSSEERPTFGLSAAFKGGTSAKGYGNHDHHDLGQFVVALKRRTPVTDPGAEPYTRRTFSAERFESEMINSLGHSVPRVAGKLQHAGARARIVSHSFSPREDVLTLDLRDAYDVPSLTKLERTFVFSRVGDGSVEVTDRVEFDRPETFGGAVITYGEIRELSPASLLLTEGPSALCVEVSSDSGTLAVSQKAIDVRFRRRPVRIGVDLTEPVRSATVVYRITPAAPDVPVSFVAVTPSFPENLKPVLARAQRVEAESVASQTRGSASSGAWAGASGQVLQKWADRGHMLTWRPVIAAGGAGVHGIRIRYRIKEALDVPVQFRANGRDTVEMLLPSVLDQGEQAGEWREAWFCRQGSVIPVELNAGENEIILIHRRGGDVMLDWLELVPLVPVP